MDLFKELGEVLSPEKDIKELAEEALSKVINPNTAGYNNYLCAYMMGYADCEINYRTSKIKKLKEELK